MLLSRSFDRCTEETQRSFGPANKYCNGGFDFTLLFEEVFFSVVPFFIILPFLSLRIYRLLRAPIVVGAAKWHLAKQVFFIMFGAIQVLSLGALAIPSTIRTKATIASIVAQILATLVLAVTSHFEHYRNPRPSSPVGIYLLTTVFFDGARVRTLFATEDARPMAIMWSVAAFVKFVLVILELKEKRAWLLNSAQFPAPESTANFLNRLTFFWVNPLLLKGYRKPVLEKDLYEVQDQITGEKNLLLLAEAWEKYPHKDQPGSLFKLAFKHHWRSFASVVIPRICYSGFNFSQSFLLQRTLRYLTTKNHANRPAIGHGLIGAYCIVYIGYGLTNALHQHRNYRSISKLRGSLIGLIYKKSLTLSSSSLSESEAVTLMNADVERITVGLRQSQELWAALFEMALAIFLLHKQISWAALTPLGVILICTGLAIGSSPKLAASQKSWLDKIQARVDATASMLGSIKAVKMTGLTPDLGDRIRGLREDEINTARTFRSMLVKLTTFSFASTSLSPVVALGTYIFMAKYQDFPQLTLSRALTSIVLMQLLLEPASFFITALSGLINTMSCMERIRQYLNSQPKEDLELFDSPSLKSHSRSQKSPYHEKSHWEKSPYLSHASEEQLARAYQEMEIDSDGVTLASFGPRRDVIIAENANCGWDKEKEPTLKDLNFRIKEGSLNMIVGPVSSGKSTLLKAILGELPFVHGMSRAYFTEIAYCSQAAWLVSGTLRENIIHGAEFDPEWYHKVIQACDLETDIGNMEFGDQTQVGSKGMGLSGGQQQRVALARAVYFRRSIILIDDVMCGLDAGTEDLVFEGVLGKKGLLRGGDTTVIYVTNTVHRLSQADHIITLGEEGTIYEQGSYNDLICQNGYVATVATGERPAINHGERKTIKGFQRCLVASKKEEEIEEVKAAGDMTVYAYYIRTFGWSKWFLFCFFCAVYGFATAFPNVWVKWWVTYNQEHPFGKVAFYLPIYAALAVISISSLVTACYILVMSMTPQAGRVLHERLLQVVLHAPMSFFMSTDTGTTTNRFSQDLELIDMELPVTLVRTAMTFFVLVAQLCVILVSAKYIAIAMPAIAAVVYFLQVYYLRTSRRLRILDIETKSFLSTQFLELLSGLATVRAFQWEVHHLSDFLKALKTAQRPFYIMYCIQRWLNMILDLIVGGMAILLVVVAVVTKETGDPAMTALALTNLVGFSNMLKQLITNWTQLETSMGALSRVRTFATETESEIMPGEDQPAPENWPSYGNIEYRNVTAFHKKAAKPTLNNLSFTISPGTKLALTGRSGSGKSSLIAALLRLMDLQSGQILIDGVDIATLSRQDVRSNLIALPQDPYILAGTIRENVDPLHQVTDDDVIYALRKVQLDHLLDDEDKGLNAKLTSHMLSHGQCQLLCLARAMMRKSSILILDEATASVDLHTDALMQDIIRTEFKHHTIIAAAHRLDTIIDFDAVLVLDAGRMIEYDNPETLLQRDSVFRDLWQMQHGTVMPWDQTTLELLNGASDRLYGAVGDSMSVFSDDSEIDMVEAMSRMPR